MPWNPLLIDYFKGNKQPEPKQPEDNLIGTPATPQVSDALRKMVGIDESVSNEQAIKDVQETQHLLDIGLEPIDFSKEPKSKDIPVDQTGNLNSQYLDSQKKNNTATDVPAIEGARTKLQNIEQTTHIESLPYIGKDRSLRYVH